jgi:hypothetical protein
MPEIVKRKNIRLILEKINTLTGDHSPGKIFESRRGCVAYANFL